LGFVVGEWLGNCFSAYKTMMFLLMKLCSAKGECIPGFDEYFLPINDSQNLTNHVNVWRLEVLVHYNDDPSRFD
jgi:hypothetical protein